MKKTIRDVYETPMMDKLDAMQKQLSRLEVRLEEIANPEDPYEKVDMIWTPKRKHTSWGEPFSARYFQKLLARETCYGGQG